MARTRRVVASALMVVAVAAGAIVVPTGTAHAAAAAPISVPPTGRSGIALEPAAAPVTTTLTCQQNGQMIDDPTSGDVVVLCTTEVVVLDAGANMVATLTGVAGTAATVLGGDVYVLEPGSQSIAQISLGTTPALVHTFALGVVVPATTGQYLAGVGSKLWFDTEGGTDALASLDPATGTVVVTTSSWSQITGLVAVPGTSTLLVSTQLTGGQRVDVSTSPPTPVGPNGDGATAVAVSADGSRFWSGGPGGVGEDDMATLAPTGVAYPPDTARPLDGGVAYSPGSGGVLTSGGEVWLSSRPVQVADDGDGSADPEGAALSADGTVLFTAISIATPQNAPGWSRVRRYSLRPTVTGVIGSAVAGVPGQLTVTGSNLGGITSATLAGITASITSNASPVGTSLLVDLPSTVAAGTHPLVLSSPLGSVSTTVTVAANSGATLSGHTAAHESVVAGIHLTLSGGGLASPRTTISAGDGSFSFSGVPYGLSYRLAAHDPSGTYADQVVPSLTLTPNSSTDIQVLLDDPPASSEELATIGLAGTARAVASDPRTGDVLVATGDTVVEFDQDGNRLGQADDQWGADSFAFDGAGSVYVDDHADGRISRLDTTTLAVTGSWATGLLGQSLAYVDGRVWFGTGQSGQVALAALDPSGGTISTYASPDGVPELSTELASVVGGDPATLLVAYVNGVSSELIEYDVTSGSPVQHASATSIAPGPVVASSATGTVWDEAGFEYRLSDLTSTGRSYPAGQPWFWSPTYSPGMGGLLAMGGDVDSVSNQSDPVDLIGDGSLMVGEALNASGTRAFVLTDDAGPALAVWDLSPHLGAVTSSLAPASTSFTLSGTGLRSATGVTVDASSRPFTVVTDPDGQADLFVSAAPLTVGWHTVSATTPWGTSDPLGFLVGTVPAAPAAPTAVPGGSQATVTWSASTDDGGFPITGYLVTASAGGATCSTTTSLTCTVTGLTNYQPYRFTVQAENQLGTGPPSAASNTVIPKPPGDWFHPLDPSRILDSRPASRVGPYSSRWVAGQTRAVTVTGVGGVPDDAAAVVLNVTVTDTTAAGYLTVWPAGSRQPLVSSLNWTAGETIANSVTVPVGSGGAVDVYNPFGQTDVVVDVVGYYVSSDGSGLVPLSSHRVLDSRPVSQVGPYSSPWAPGETRPVAVGSTGWVPTDATAVVLNVTITDPTTAGYLTVWPAGVSQPLASSLNWSAGETIPNAVTVPLGPDRTIDVYNAFGRTDVVVDVVGYFMDGPGGQPFHPVAPARILDTRLGPTPEPLGPDEAGEAQVAGLAGVPDQATAVMTNITVTDTTDSSFLAVWPGDAQYQGGSSLNWTAGETIANAVVIADDQTDLAWIGNASGETDVVIDVSGWYG